MTTEPILTPEELVNALVEIRKERKLSKTQFAKSLYVSRQQLDQITDNPTNFPKIPAIYRGLLNNYPEFKKTIKAWLGKSND